MPRRIGAKGVPQMFARMTTIQTTPDGIEELRRFIESQIIPAARQLEGFEGAYFLADRQAGRVVSVTLWSSEAARELSEERASQLGAGAAQESSGTVERVDRFEVIAQA
jgi:heme-degrading monooxygenase HmoA